MGLRSEEEGGDGVMQKKSLKIYGCGDNVVFESECERIGIPCDTSKVDPNEVAELFSEAFKEVESNE